jgi:thiamine pyrophosphate-dependent acetolactate synthase large subunit-like protein
MTKKKEANASGSGTLDRRKFIKGVAVAGASAVAVGESAKAAVLPQHDPTHPLPSALRPSAQIMAAESGSVQEAGADGSPGTVSGKPGSDFMVDVVKTLGIEYVITNPASSCRGIHESLVSYGGNVMPELLTATHEETATAMGHGYFKVSGKPLIALCHGTVGLQHAAMAVYNAWCDRVPVIMMVGNNTDAATRPPGTPTLHTVQDPGSIVRDYTKWDDQPGSLQHYAESMVRAYKFAMTPPFEPVLISIQEHMQEHEIHSAKPLTIPRLTTPSFPAGDMNAVREAATLLANADFPVIVVDRAARSQQGMQKIVELAESVNALVIDRYGRMNMPNTHYLYQMGGAALRRADVVLGLELTDYWGTVNDFSDNVAQNVSSNVSPDTKLISIGVGDIYVRANYQDFQRYQPVDIAIAADAETTLPSLVEAVKATIPSARQAAIEQRGVEARRNQAALREQTLAEAAANGWDVRPISSARLSAELWAQIKNEDWALVSRDQSLSFWPHRLWSFENHHQFIGGPGGQGIGYGLPAAIGAALGHREHGRLVVNLQNDGDFMYAPGSLWSAAHHNIPLLNIIYNNRAYHQEVMHMQRMASWRQRGVENALIGTVITDPNISFAAMAQSMGVEGIGPIEDPNDLSEAIRRGIEVVKSGDPVVIDVIAQPR